MIEWKKNEDGSYTYPGSKEAIFELLDPCRKDVPEALHEALELAESGGLAESYTGELEDVKKLYEALGAVVGEIYGRVM